MPGVAGKTGQRHTHAGSRNVAPIAAHVDGKQAGGSKSVLSSLKGFGASGMIGQSVAHKSFGTGIRQGRSFTVMSAAAGSGDNVPDP